MNIFCSIEEGAQHPTVRWVPAIRERVAALVFIARFLALSQVLRPLTFCVDIANLLSKICRHLSAVTVEFVTLSLRSNQFVAAFRCHVRLQAFPRDLSLHQGRRRDPVQLKYVCRSMAVKCCIIVSSRSLGFLPKALIIGAP